MTTINKIYFYFTFIYLSKNLFTPRHKLTKLKDVKFIGLKMICTRGLLVSFKVDACFNFYIRSRLSVLLLVLNELLKFFPLNSVNDIVTCNSIIASTVNFVCNCQ